MAAQNQSQLRLGRREPGIDAYADRLTGAHADPRRPLEKNLRAGLPVYVGVHALTRAVLGVAEAGAHLIGAAAGPNLSRMNWRQRLGGLVVTARHTRCQFRQRNRFSFRSPDQVEYRVIGNRP